MDIFQFFSYAFVQRALLVGILISAPCSMLGVFLVLRRMSLIGDGLAHVTFGGSALALAFKLYSTASLLVTLPIALLSSLGILKLMEKARLSGDAAIGIVSALGIATGVIMASVGDGYNVDLLGYLFGNILAITQEEVLIAAGLCCVVSTFLALFYHDLAAVTFNEELAKVSGVRVKFINTALAFLTALSVVLAMKLVGVMLISSLLILPAASALQLARSFRACVFLALLQGCCSVMGGILFSLMANLPASATIVLINFLCFCCAFLARWIRNFQRNGVIRQSRH